MGDVWSGWDGGDEGGVRVLSLRRVSSAKIVSVSEQTSADIDSEGARGGVEGGGGPLSSKKTSRKGVICVESRLFAF